MKTALAIVCSLVFAWTGLVLAQSPAVSEGFAAKALCPCPCGTASCCSAQPVSESQPVSATPTSSFQTLLFAPASLATWQLPETSARGPGFPAHSLFPAVTAPLYQRNCAWLI